MDLDKGAMVVLETNHPDIHEGNEGFDALYSEEVEALEHTLELFFDLLRDDDEDTKEKQVKVDAAAIKKKNESFAYDTETITTTTTCGTGSCQREGDDDDSCLFSSDGSDRDENFIVTEYRSSASKFEFDGIAATLCGIGSYKREGDDDDSCLSSSDGSVRDENYFLTEHTSSALKFEFDDHMQEWETLEKFFCMNHYNEKHCDTMFCMSHYNEKQGDVLHSAEDCISANIADSCCRDYDEDEEADYPFSFEQDIWKDIVHELDSSMRSDDFSCDSYEDRLTTIYEKDEYEELTNKEFVEVVNEEFVEVVISSDEGFGVDSLLVIANEATEPNDTSVSQDTSFVALWPTLDQTLHEEPIEKKSYKGVVVEPLLVIANEATESNGRCVSQDTSFAGSMALWSTLDQTLEKEPIEEKSYDFKLDWIEKLENESTVESNKDAEDTSNDRMRVAFDTRRPKRYKTRITVHTYN